MASRSASLVSRFAAQARAHTLRTAATTSSPYLRLSQRLQPRQLPTLFVRAAHSIPRPPPVQPSAATSASSPSSPSPGEQDEAAATSEGERPEIKDPAYYQLSFTCIPCDHRSHHNISKQGYHRGSVLITCPNCRNRHVISDHLGIFGDRNITVEDLMREKGQLVKRGSLGEDGDVEFWPDERYAQAEAQRTGTGHA
ncbi:hypothetical protein S40293_05831 [Stachybotrys chartarum IBT 40293]|nr:hypothetical protein S40293_05831 [Stachybotrys chartarum IBT 40293]KFA73342.1 hypothetical protein S40288_03914 [Stachybotrys chartarum IBT 40288]